MSFDPSLTDKRVVVTGATGFIGKRVVAALLRSGAEVHVILRSKHGKARFEGMGAKVFAGGYADAAALKAVLGATDVLFNFAYDMRASKGDNLAAFDLLLAGAVTAGVRRIVHASSIVVYDDWPGGDVTAGSMISTSTGGGYRQAKIEMERRLETCGIPSAILQPTLVYGPGSALWTTRILEQLQSGPVVLPDLDGVCNAVYVDDVAQAALKAAVVEDLTCERFIVSGAQPVSWQQYYAKYQSLVPGSEIRREDVQTLRARLGPEPEPSQAPAGPSLAAKVSAALRGLIGNENFEKAVRTAKGFRAKGAISYPNRGDLELLTATGACHIDATAERLGYKPEFDLDAGIQQIAGSIN